MTEHELTPETLEFLRKLGITPKEFRLAFGFWRGYYWHHRTDEEGWPYLKLEKLGYGRLKKTRQALLTSTNRAAALGCELVYNLRPKRRISLAWVIWEAFYLGAMKDWDIEKLPRDRRWRVLHAVARKSLRSPLFRRFQNWNKRLFVNDGADQDWRSWID